MKRILPLFLIAIGALTVGGATSEKLLTGSIDFDNSALWGKEIYHGLDDNGGNSPSATHWYLDPGETGLNRILQRTDGEKSVEGYLSLNSDTGVHRTIPVTRNETGPEDQDGQSIEKLGVYFDAEVMLYASTDAGVKQFNENDKLVCWYYRENEESTTASFMITAGYEAGLQVVATNYPTARVFSIAELESSHRLTLHAFTTNSMTYFEVYLDGTKVKALDGTDRFLSMYRGSSTREKSVYSLGFRGACSAEFINFTRVDPIADPDYAKPDLSMFRQATVFTIDGYPAFSGALTNFPALIRISEDSIENFRYSTTAKYGSDLRFTDEGGNVLSFDIDTWDTEGESRVWVKVPYFKNGAKITMYWDLKPGSAVSANDSRDVWSEYIAVWHLSESNNRKKYDDSTGHHLTARLEDEELVVDDFEATYPMIGQFTYTGWYVTPGLEDLNQKLFGQKELIKAGNGWSGVNRGYKTPAFYQDGETNVFAYEMIEDMRKQPFHAGFVFEGGNIARIYANGALGQEATGVSITHVETNLLLAANGVEADEIRITSMVRSHDWIRAEYAQGNNVKYFSNAGAGAKGTYNFWLDEPCITPTAWTPEAYNRGEVTFFEGKPRYGDMYVSYYDAEGNKLASRPTVEVGNYRMVCMAKDGVHETIVKEISFSIYDLRGYSVLEGYNRVMLFNSYSNGEQMVSLQGAWDVDENENSVWTHEGEPWAGTGKYVIDGTTHVYYEPGTGGAQSHGRRLWTFHHARIGNLFRGLETATTPAKGLAENMNYLPWSKFGMRYDNSEMPANYQIYAGALILQNVSGDKDPAGAYSARFEDGIGTVYFDAVNAYCDYPNTIKLQYTRNDPQDETNVTEGTWHDIPMSVFAVSNGTIVAVQHNQVEAELAMRAHGQNTNSFYRIRATVDTNAAVRVRIIRTDKKWGASGDDGEGLILIDNIVVSPRAAGIRLKQFGAPEEPGNIHFRGQKAPFTVAFPSTNDFGRLKGAVKVEYVGDGADPSSLGILTMFYRYRYLDQYVGKWEASAMTPYNGDPTKYVTEDALTGAGVGDIEYYFSAVVNAPYYDYYDYSGFSDSNDGKWNWGGRDLSERRDNVSLSAADEGLYSLGKPSAAGGTNYFVRIREGASEYEGFRLYIRKVGESTTIGTMVRMELYSDNTWRGYYETLTNHEEGIEYRIEAINRQTESLGDYQYNTNHYHSTSVDPERYDKIPFNGVMELDSSSEVLEWTTLPCDAATGHLLFQIEDTTRSISILHADYQNFNRWDDAWSPSTNAYFTGTSSILPTSGVSRLARTITDSFEQFTETSPTNAAWVEHFDVPASTGGVYAINIPFTGSVASPNGWTAANGKWVSQEYNMLGTTSISLQMENRGHGEFYRKNLTARGIDKLKFTARVAQSLDIHSFNYYAGSTNDVYNMTNCSFGVLAAMKTPGGEDFLGCGSVSVLGHFRDSKGGYELRVTRCAQKLVQLSLYKWFADGTATCLGTYERADFRFEKEGGNPGLGFDGFMDGSTGSKYMFAGLFISCSNTANSVIINAGIRNTALPANVEPTIFNGKYWVVSYEDSEDDRHQSGTFGVGCNDCPATFVFPKYVNVGFRKFGDKGTGNFTYADSVVSVAASNEQRFFPADTAYWRYNPRVYDEWNVYEGRLRIKDFTNDIPVGVYGFKADTPMQQLLVETSPRNKDSWSVLERKIVSSFDLADYEAVVRNPEDIDIRLRTGLEADGSEIVIDDVELTQWRGEMYNADDNPDYRGKADLRVGCPTNFVYTSAWVSNDGALELSPMRAVSNIPCGVRGPLFDGLNDRGIGLGRFSLRYRDADKHARLLVQIMTNVVGSTEMYDMLVTRTESMTDSAWITVETIDFMDKTMDELPAGVINANPNNFSRLHGVPFLMRIILDPTLIEEARTTEDPDYGDLDPAYGRIYLVSASADDNPPLDPSSWWGWNLRTTDDAEKLLLKDGAWDDVGKAYALNNSIVRDVLADNEYKQHMPFLQTPVFTTRTGGVIGEVSFKARRYSTDAGTPTITIYGTTSLERYPKDSEFEALPDSEILITSDRYETYTYQAPINRNYTGFRLAVTGVAGITGDGSGGDSKGPTPQSGIVARVLIDEVAVFEAIKARIGFRNVGCFRSGMADNKMKDPFPVKSEQPICGEQWGFQAELYAAQLSEKIDTKTPGREPKVYVYWFVGEQPWGYDNWMNNDNAQHAELALASNAGKQLVYRSSHEFAPQAIVQMSEKQSVVQFSMKVVYYMENQPVPMTNTLSSADWVKPSWYEPVDLNAEHGGESFSAYNIIDTVAPGWAWFNEFNIFGEYDDDYDNTDKNYQWLEIAAPMEADLTDWSVRMLVPRSGSNAVVTNVVATFGFDGLTGMKKYPGDLNQASGMVFRVIASPYTRTAKKLNLKEGTLDGSWSIPNPSGVLQSSGVIGEDEPFGVQLVRPSGIVEHELVLIGTNYWGSKSSYAEQYAPSNTVNYFNKYMKGAHFFYVGKDDCRGTAHSLGVWDSRGEASNYWDNALVHTPGKINMYADGTTQILSPEHPTPLGESIFIYANLGSDHIRQTCGDGVNTNVSQILIVQKGSPRGTNITYNVDAWYELGSVLTNGVELTQWRTNSTYQYTVNVGSYMSNNITVVASAQVCKKLRDYGVDDNNRYSSAIIDWFSKHRNLAGVEWPDSNSEIKLAKFWPYRRNLSEAVDMTLTEMYWLDMCPTILDEQQYLIAGFDKPATPIVRPKDEYQEYEWDETVTNRQMTIFMAISNGLGLVENTGITNTYYAPYVIRGLDPDSTSWGFSTNSAAWSYGWSNVTFKATGILANGLTRISNPTNWVPLRLFVFDSNSFYKYDMTDVLGEHKQFTTEIEVVDPYTPQSLGYRSGWGDWMLSHKKICPIFFRWSVDEFMQPVGVEILKPNNYFKKP